MYRFVIIIYLICFSLYVLFTRQPDFFDGLITKGSIHFQKDSVSHVVPYAFYSVDDKIYAVDAGYLFKNYHPDEAINIIYESSEPSKASVYSIWGYWLRWKEILSTIIIWVILYEIAVAITSHPTPEGLISDIENAASKKRKYN